MIGGQKAAIEVSQRNADSRIFKDGSPSLLAFPKGIFSTLPLLKIGICSVPLRDVPRLVAQRTTAKENRKNLTTTGRLRKTCRSLPQKLS